MKVSLNWLKDYVNVKASVEELAHRLTMGGLEAKVPVAIGNDSVMDIEITSNRPDWLSHIGVAREISAIFRKKLNVPELKISSKMFQTDRLFRIAIESLKLCPYYSAVLLEDVKAIQTPDLIKRRLEALGLRSVNFLVDATNYVLMEIGQPLHAFDADLIQGDTIYVRPARKGEKLTAIDGKEYELISTDLVIADASGPIAIAGVMGGKSTEISSKTKNVLLESAFFDPVSVRSTARRLGLVSDSSYRFERKVDPHGVNWGRDRAVQIISEHASIGKISKVYRNGKLPVTRKKILLPLDFLKKTLGISLPAVEVVGILEYLGLSVRKNKTNLLVDIPQFRPDLLAPIDLVEEIARIHGYDRLPETLPALLPLAKMENAIFPFLDEVSELAKSAGFDEVVNFSLIHEENLLKTNWKSDSLTRIINPQHKELSVMRPTLMQGLVENVQRNLNLGNLNLAFFEIGRVYGPEQSNRLPDETWHLGLAITGKKLLNWKDKGRPVMLYDLKGVIRTLEEHLAITNLHFVESHHPFLSDQANLEIRFGIDPVGILGELRDEIREHYDIPQKTFLAEINLELVSKHRALKKQFVPFSKFPAVERDLALLVPKQIKAANLIDQIKKTAGGLLKQVELFDVFESDKLPTGIKSLGVTMNFQSEEKTLSSEEINTLQDKILADLKTHFGAYLR